MALDRADAVDGAILIGHDETERQEPPNLTADIDHRGEWRFEHESPDGAQEGKAGGDAGTKRLAIGNDIARCHAELVLQIFVRRDGVGDVVGLGRPAARGAIAAIVQHEHAISACRDRLDLARAICDRAALAGEIKERGLAAPRRQIPGDQLCAAFAGERNFLDLGKTDLARRIALLVRHVEEVAMQYPGADADEGVSTEKGEQQI